MGFKKNSNHKFQGQSHREEGKRNEDWRRILLHFSSSFFLASVSLSGLFRERSVRIELRKEREKSRRMRGFSFSRRSSCSSYSLPRERASICRRKDRDKPRVKGRKREEKREDTGCHEMRCDTLGYLSRGSRLPGEPKQTIVVPTNQ